MATHERAHAELEKIIDSVNASYQGGREIDNLESAALPSQRKVAEALLQLEHVVYMGCYSARDLDRTNLRHHIGEHLHAAFDMLVEQVSRAVTYYREGGSDPTSDDVKWSEHAILDVFRQLPRIRELAALDVQAAYEGDPAANSIEEIIFSYPGVQATTVYRLAHEFFVRGVPMIPRIMTEDVHGRTGIDIHPGATIGEAFFIDHGTGVVVGETTTIGDRVKLYQGVTLGALSIARDEAGAVIRDLKRHPTIEDDVTIYAGAKILGGETVIGAGSIIGGNVWLTKSVPPGSRVTYTMAGPGCETQTVEPAESTSAARSGTG